MTKTHAEFLEELEQLRNHIWLLKQGIEHQINKQFDYVLTKINQKIEQFQKELNNENK